jgi:hypothetical protein
MAIAPAPLPVQSPESLLGGWHVNTVDHGTYHFLVFLNDESLYCLVDVILTSLRTVDLALVFRRSLLGTLLRNDISQTQIERIGEEYSEHIITKTDNRRVIGNLNDIINQLDFLIEVAIDENKRIDLQEIEDQLNLIPQRNISWRFSVDVFREILGVS